MCVWGGEGGSRWPNNFASTLLKVVHAAAAQMKFLRGCTGSNMSDAAISAAGFFFFSLTGVEVVAVITASLKSLSSGEWTNRVPAL